MDQQVSPALRRTRFKIAGFAQAFPSTVLKNRELALQLGVDPEWIRARCGVHSRYVSGPGETTTTLGVRAARQAPLEYTVVPSRLPDLRYVYAGLPAVPLRSSHRARTGTGADTRLRS